MDWQQFVEIYINMSKLSEVPVIVCYNTKNSMCFWYRHSERNAMGNLMREDLEPLKKRLQELSEFLYALHVEELPYFHRFIENMKNNLEICFLVQYDGWEDLEHILRRDWNAANNVLTGIPDFVIWVENQERRAELNCQFIELIADVGRYLELKKYAGN